MAELNEEWVRAEIRHQWEDMMKEWIKKEIEIQIKNSVERENGLAVKPWVKEEVRIQLARATTK